MTDDVYTTSQLELHTVSHCGCCPVSPSLSHQSAVALLRLLRVAPGGSPERIPTKLAKRDAQGGDGAPGPSAVRGLTVEQHIDHGWLIWTLKPLRAAERTNRIILAVHGGAYIQEIQNSHYRAYADIVRRSGATVQVPIYPLAPHGTAGTVVPVVADIMSKLVSEHGAAQVSILGDSAGAGLALAAVQELVRRGKTTPSQLVLISPWLDATLSDPRSRAIKDPMLNVDGLIAAGKLWAGDLDPADWRVSPLFGSMAGIPQTSVYAGTLDALVPDSYRLQDQATREGLKITFTIRPGLIHAWAGFTILPEYREAGPSIVRDLVGPSPIAR